VKKRCDDDGWNRDCSTLTQSPFNIFLISFEKDTSKRDETVARKRVKINPLTLRHPHSTNSSRSIICQVEEKEE